MSTDAGMTACPACGRPTRVGARFCTGCGTPLSAGPAPVPGPQVPAPPAQPGQAGAPRWAAPPPPAPVVPQQGAAPTRRAQRAGTAVAEPEVHVIQAQPVAPARARTGARAAVGLGPSFGDAPAATLGARLGAYLVDAAAVSVVGVATLLLTGRPALAGLIAAEVVVGLVVWESRTGRTLGNLALGLRASRVESPYALGAGRAGLRALVLAAGHLVAGLGQWVVVGSVAADSSPRRQGWHDRAGRAVVVDVRRMPEPVAPDAAAPPTSVQPTATSRQRPASAPPVGTVAATAPAAPAVPQTPAARPVPSRYLVTLDTGDVWTVHGQGLVGRSPQVREGERYDHLIAIEDPERSLSRTHAVFGVARTGFWVRDAGSGNGTVLVLPSGQAVTVTAEQAVTVPSGSTVRIGGRAFTVQEVPPA